MSDGPPDYEPNTGLNSDLGAAAGYELVQTSDGKWMYRATKDHPSEKRDK